MFALRPAALRLQIGKRRHARPQDFVVVLRHIKGAPPFSRLRGDSQQRGLSAPVSAHDADAFPALHGQAHVFCEQSVSRNQARKGYFQRRLACRHGKNGEAHQNALLPFGGLRHIFPLPPIALFLGENGFHLLFQKPRAVRIRAADRIQPPLHLIPDHAQFFLPFFRFRALVRGDLRLLFPGAQKRLPVCAVSAAEKGMARLRAAAQALEVEHAVCRPFQQPLVVRNEQNGLFQSAYHLLQPCKRLKIQVVGRLVQQPDGGFLKKHLCEEQFDFLPARQRPHALIRPEKPRFHAQPARVFRQLARIRRIQCGRKKFHRADCGKFGFLREISLPLAAEIRLSLSHGVFLRQFFVIKIFQQRRLSVSLFPDQGDFVSLVQRQREIFDDRQQIPAVV